MVAPEERVAVMPVAPVPSIVTTPEIVPTAGAAGGTTVGGTSPSSHAVKVKAISVAMVSSLSLFMKRSSSGGNEYWSERDEWGYTELRSCKGGANFGILLSLNQLRIIT